MRNIGVVVAHDDRQVVQEVGDALEAAPDLFVAATSVEAARPGLVLLAGGDALLRLGRIASPVVALADGDTIRAARAAIAAGARDIVVWPSESDRLAGAIRRAASDVVTGGARGRVIAVAGARGGAGCSTVAAVLAARLPEGVVIDLDGGQRAFASDDPVRFVNDLAGSDVAPEDLTASLLPHAGGARCLHVAGELAVSIHGILRVARVVTPFTVLDCGRALSSGTRAAFEAADARVVVVPNDVASVRAAKDLRAQVVVVRRVRRDGVARKDIIAALGMEPKAVVPNDRAIARAADLGKLPSRPTAGTRALTKLARALEETS